MKFKNLAVFLVLFFILGCSSKEVTIRSTPTGATIVKVGWFSEEEIEQNTPHKICAKDCESSLLRKDGYEDAHYDSKLCKNNEFMVELRPKGQYWLIIDSQPQGASILMGEQIGEGSWGNYEEIGATTPFKKLVTCPGPGISDRPWRVKKSGYLKTMEILTPFNLFCKSSTKTINFSLEKE